MRKKCCGDLHSLQSSETDGGWLFNVHSQELLLLSKSKSYFPNSNCHFYRRDKSFDLCLVFMSKLSPKTSAMHEIYTIFSANHSICTRKKHNSLQFICLNNLSAYINCKYSNWKNMHVFKSKSCFMICILKDQSRVVSTKTWVQNWSGGSVLSFVGIERRYSWQSFELIVLQQTLITKQNELHAMSVFLFSWPINVWGKL